MFAKLLVIILALGVACCILLVTRQQRIEASFALTNMHRRVAQHERSLWKLRTEISELASPERIRAMPERLAEDWVPLAIELERQRREQERAFAEGETTLPRAGEHGIR